MSNQMIVCFSWKEMLDSNSEQLLNEIKILKQLLVEKDDTITQMQEHILSLETDVPQKNKKRRLGNPGEIDNNENKLERLNKENETLRAKVNKLKGEGLRNRVYRE